MRGTGFGSALGVYGESDSGSGVAGRSTSGNAVEGDSPNGHGVVGRFGTGLLNIPQSGSGVLGQSTWIGVQGIANGSNSWGVYSVGDLGTSGNLYVT